MQTLRWREKASCSGFARESETDRGEIYGEEPLEIDGRDPGIPRRSSLLHSFTTIRSRDPVVSGNHSPFFTRVTTNAGKGNEFPPSIHYQYRGRTYILQNTILMYLNLHFPTITKSYNLQLIRPFPSKST